MGRWQADHAAGFRSLRYRRGPGFLEVRDRRPGLEPADYTFGDREARIYLACEDGATVAAASAAVREAGDSDLSAGEIRDFLDELVAARLVHEEAGRYLALALPVTLVEAA